MAQESYPFDAASLAEDAWSRMARQWQDWGVVSEPGGAGLLVTANSSGMQVFVAAGEAQVRGHHYRNNASLAVTIGANGAGSARTDCIVLRLDPTANSVVVAVVSGTAGSGTPALTQTDAGTYELPLALVTVDAGAASIAANKVTDDRRFTGTRSRACRTVSDIASPRVGQGAYESSTGLQKVWNGSSWEVLSGGVRGAGLALAADENTFLSSSFGDIILPQPASLATIVTCVAMVSDYVNNPGFWLVGWSQAPRYFQVRSPSGIETNKDVRVRYIMIGTPA